MDRMDLPCSLSDETGLPIGTSTSAFPEGQEIRELNPPWEIVEQAESKLLPPTTGKRPKSTTPSEPTDGTDAPCDALPAQAPAMLGGEEQSLEEAIVNYVQAHSPASPSGLVGHISRRRGVGKVEVNTTLRGLLQARKLREQPHGFITM
jgi:hypothetical protein